MSLEAQEGIRGRHAAVSPSSLHPDEPPALSGGLAGSQAAFVELPVELPGVAVVGRPNVGKSTLVNRIIGRRDAIVEQHPGVTRDRKSWIADWRGRSFSLIDTGGWLPEVTGGDPDADLRSKVSAQSRKAILEADVVVLVVDVSSGITETDAEVAALLHHRDRPSLLAVNKVDDEMRALLTWEFMSLGLGEPFPISALHGRGTADLLDAVIEQLDDLLRSETSTGAANLSSSSSVTPEVLPAAPAAPPRDALPEDALHPPAQRSASAACDFSTVSVAIVGRPNVGKSTLFNRLVGSERSVTHDVPGTTRDSVDSLLHTPHGVIRLIDTAGLRRRSKVSESTEYYASLRALQSVDRADVVLFVIDAAQGVTHQDKRLAERVDASGSPIILLLNKWDELQPNREEDPASEAAERLGFLSGAPVLRISALTGRGTHRILPALSGAVAQYRRRIPTQAVNRALREAQSAHPAPGGARVLYAAQGATDPPTFTLFANRTLPPTYLRYLERSLRETFNLGGSPVKLRVRRR